MPTYRPGGSRGYNEGWEDTGASLGRLIGTILLRKQLQAQELFPSFLEAVKKSELTGETGPPAEMVKKTPRLAKLYKKYTGEEAPQFTESGTPAPPTTKTLGPPRPANVRTLGELLGRPEMQDPRRLVGPAVNIPGSTISTPPAKWPVAPGDVKARIESELRAGKPLPEVYQNEILRDKTRYATEIQSRNKAQGQIVANQEGIALAPPDEKSTQSDQSLQRQRIVEGWIADYKIFDSKSGKWIDISTKDPLIRDFVKTGNPAFMDTSELKLKTREEQGYTTPGEKGDFVASNFTPDKLLQMYMNPLMKVHGGDRAAAERDFQQRMASFYNDYAGNLRAVPVVWGDLMPDMISNNLIRSVTREKMANTIYRYSNGEVPYDEIMRELNNNTLSPELQDLYQKASKREADENEMMQFLSNPTLRDRKKAIDGLVLKLMTNRGMVKGKKDLTKVQAFIQALSGRIYLFKPQFLNKDDPASYFDYKDPVAWLDDRVAELPKAIVDAAMEKEPEGPPKPDWMNDPKLPSSSIIKGMFP